MPMRAWAQGSGRVGGRRIRDLAGTSTPLLLSPRATAALLPVSAAVPVLGRVVALRGGGGGPALLELVLVARARAIRIPSTVDANEAKGADGLALGYRWVLNQAQCRPA
ncbi:hypothetical protein TgHK011_005602 [Trichoderma gracile]|nr:hypothetical protein TgHK011_005602 [Trichoderma gracile]